MNGTGLVYVFLIMSMQHLGASRIESMRMPRTQQQLNSNDLADSMWIEVKFLHHSFSHSHNVCATISLGMNGGSIRGNYMVLRDLYTHILSTSNIYWLKATVIIRKRCFELPITAGCLCSFKFACLFSLRVSPSPYAKLSVDVCGFFLFMRLLILYFLLFFLGYECKIFHFYCQ